jgi:uncharacterized protein (DUF2062 family)
MPQARRGLAQLTLTQRARELFERATREHSTPREVGWSVGIGVFCACTPFLGLHMWMALLLATGLRVNRLWAFLGSRASIGPLFPGIAFCEIESAHRLRTGAWASLAPREALAHGRALLTDWLVGTALIGSALAVAAGLLAYAWATRRPPSSYTPGELHPPSSGSPP